MNLRFYLLILFFCALLPAKVLSQQPNYDLAARFSRNKIDKFTYSTRVIPYWFKNSDKFWYSYSTSQGTNYYVVDPMKNSKRKLFDNGWMAARLTEIVGDPFDAQNLPIGRLLLLGDSLFTFHIVSTAKEDRVDTLTGKPRTGPKIHGFTYDYEKNILKEIKDFQFPSMYPVWASVSPDNRYAVLSKNHNLFLITWEDYEKARINYKDSTIVYKQITFDGTAEFPYGSGSADLYLDARKEHGPERPNVVWSPDSRHFAIVRTDYTGVKDMWVINSLATPRPVLETYNYHMPGEAESPQKHLYVYDLSKDSLQAIKSQRFKDQDLVVHERPRAANTTFDEVKYNVWEGNGNFFLVSRISRDHKRVDLCRFDVASDTLIPIIEERMNTYVETRNPLVRNNQIIWWSQRDGWGHLYRYDPTGKLVNRITSGEFHVENVVAYDTVSQRVYFSAYGYNPNINPYYSQVYRAGADGTGLKPVVIGDFDNQINITDNGSFTVNNYSRVNTIPSSSLLDKDGNVLIELETSDFSTLLSMGYKFPEPFKVKSADGKTDLYGVMYKPYDFDSTRSYPIIQYVYPGPHTEAVDFSWSSRLDDTDRLAQIGFVVVTVGNRGGSPLRSKWYHNYGYGNLRDYGLEDKKFAVEQLAAKHSFIDGKRVGMHGHSGGGFMTAAALLVYPDFFKVGISSAGNHDNRIYNRWWGELHHGVDEVVTAAGDTTFKFKIDTNMDLAPRLKGRLMLITGDTDNNVHPANTYRLVNALIKANKRFDIFILPGQRHSLSSVGEYLFWLKADYFSKYLLGDYQDDVDIVQLHNN